MARDVHVVRKEMGYSHAEFLRLLPKAVNGSALRVEGDRITVEDGGRRLEIEIGEETERRIANLRLPVTPVSLAFAGYSEAEIKAALERFWRAYQKGGG